MQLETLSRLLQSDPSNLRLRRDCIDAALRSRDYQSVVTLADEWLQHSPDDVEMRFAKANGLIGGRDYQGAIELLNRIQLVDPQNLVVGQNLGLCFYCIGDFEAARGQLEAVYAAEVHSADIVRLLVSSCHHLGLMDRATEIADENRELARTDSALAGVYSLVYVDVSRPADAAKCAAYSLRGNPNCIDALTSHATLQLAAGDVAEAEQKFERVLSLNPKVGRAYLGLGSAALLQQDFEKAKSNINLALTSMPEHVGTWHLLGWAHMMSGELDDAERAFQRAMELDRNFAETHGALASIAAMRGDYEAAQDSIRVALRLDPESLAARHAQSVLAQRSGDAQKSQQIVRDAIAPMIAGDAGGFAKMISAAIRKKR